MIFAVYLYQSRYEAWILQRYFRKLEQAEEQQQLTFCKLLLLGEQAEDAKSFISIKVFSDIPPQSISSTTWGDF